MSKFNRSFFPSMKKIGKNPKMQEAMDNAKKATKDGKIDETILNESKKPEGINAEEANGKYTTEDIKETIDRAEEEAKKIVNDDDKTKKEVNFKDIIFMFQIILKYITIIAIIIVFGLFLISFTSFLILLYDSIIYIINLFVNPNLTKALSIDYLSKNIIKCTKNNYKDDRYLILSEQKQNLILFNLGSYTIYLLLFYIMIYILFKIYASMVYKVVKGELYELDERAFLLIILGIIFVYSAINLAIYKLFFKPFVYIPFKHIDNNEKNVDEKISEYVLIKNASNKQAGKAVILVDENFFDILYDFSRIDELNNIFLIGIKNNDANGCLEQQIIIYDLYMYLREYISFDDKMQTIFKQYCTTEANEKPIYDGTDTRITFLSLLNNNEIKIIKKYHEELDYYNNIPNDNIEFYNTLNRSIDRKLREINRNMVTHKETLIPFLLSISYIFFILLLNFIIIYIIIKFNNNMKKI